MPAAAAGHGRAVAAVIFAQKPFVVLQDLLRARTWVLCSERSNTHTGGQPAESAALAAPTADAHCLFHLPRYSNAEWPDRPLATVARAQCLSSKGLIGEGRKGGREEGRKGARVGREQVVMGVSIAHQGPLLGTPQSRTARAADTGATCQTPEAVSGG